MTEHRHEWELGMMWSRFCDDPPDFDGYKLTCKTCDEEITSTDEIERILNEHSTLKRATDVLSAEDAISIATKLRGTFPKLANMMYKFARILSPTDGGEDETA